MRESLPDCLQTATFVNKIHGIFRTAVLLMCLLVGTFEISNAQPSCTGEFTISAVRSYDPVTDKTTYTYTITRTGAQNALSHWGFPITLCPGQPGTVESIL